MAPPRPWRIELARASFFLARPVQANAVGGWWQQFARSEPREYSSQPELGLSQWGGLIAEPALTAASLHLLYNENERRIDWQLRPIQPVVPPANDRQFRTIGSYWDCAPAFEQCVASWLDVIDVSITRIAFGVVLLHAPPDPGDLPAELASLLRMTEADLAGLELVDFMLQLNRRRPSIPLGAGAMVNRLSKWSVPTMRGFRFDAAANQGKPFEGETVIRLELDINSDPASAPEMLPKRLWGRHFAELAQMAREMAEKGDIA